MEESIVSPMDEIRRNVELLESSLPKRVDGWALSQMSKLPFKVLVYREALAWRMAELGRAAFEEFEKDRLAAAIVLTRAAVETSAALWYLCGKVEASVESVEVGDIFVSGENILRQVQFTRLRTSFERSHSGVRPSYQ